MKKEASLHFWRDCSTGHDIYLTLQVWISSFEYWKRKLSSTFLASSNSGLGNYIDISEVKWLAFVLYTVVLSLGLFKWLQLRVYPVQKLWKCSSAFHLGEWHNPLPPQPPVLLHAHASVRLLREDITQQRKLGLALTPCTLLLLKNVFVTSAEG